MKNRILFPLVCFLLLLNSNLKAQEFKYGIVGGVDVTNIRVTDIPFTDGSIKPYSSMFSFNVNGYVGYKSSGFWGVSVEPGFIQKGGILKYHLNGTIVDVRLQLNYIQLPIYFDFYLNRRWSLSVGPEFAYLINVRARSNQNSNDLSSLYNRKYELSGSVGVNFNVNKHFDIGLKYNHAFTHFDEIIWADVWGYPIGESNEFNFYMQAFVRFKI